MASVGGRGLVSGVGVLWSGRGEVVPLVPLISQGLAYPRTRKVVFGDESEKSFQRRVLELAQVCGWVAWHTLDSTGTRAGEPDLRLCRPPRYLLVELKSQHGRLSLAQAQAIALLEQCPGIEVFVFRPSDWSRVVEVLR